MSRKDWSDEQRNAWLDAVEQGSAALSNHEDAVKYHLRAREFPAAWECAKDFAREMVKPPPDILRKPRRD